MVTFGEPLGHVITVCGQILVSRTHDDPLPPRRVRSKRARVYVQNVPMCTSTTPACGNTCGRGAGTHGGRFERTHGHVFQCVTPPHTTNNTPHTHHDTHHNNSSSNNTEQHTETDRQRQRKKTREGKTRDKRREEKRRKRSDKREDEKEERR